MSGHQNLALEDTAYLYFAANDTSGSGGDGATPLFDVRLGGATASAAPVLSGTPDLLTHANYPAGAHEIAVAATAANGFASAGVYGVFCTLAVDSQNPTGFVGSFTLTALATSDQVGQLAVGSAAISVQAESYTLTTGTQSSGTVSDTETRDGTSHQHTDTGGAMELYYQFDVGGAGVATEVETFGRINSANDDLVMYAYDWGNTQWDAIGSFDGQGSTTNVQRSRSLLTRHTGTGVNLGKVRVRFYAASGLTTSTLYMDQIFTSYAVVSQTVGYANGMFWLDTAEGTAGTEVYVNGTADKPSDSLADIITMESTIPLHNINVSSDSTFAPTGDFNDYNVYGVGYTANMGGHDYSGTHIYHASPLTGIILSATEHVDILDSIVGAVTLL